MSFVAQLKQHANWPFVRQLLMIALPIALQSMMFSSRSLVDVLMLGQLGEAEIAAVGVAARATFVTTIMLVGVTTAGALLSAQYWGAGDTQGVRKSLALTCTIALAFSFAAVSVFLFAPEQVMRIASDDLAVVALGADYLFIAGWSMVAVAMIASMANGLRSVRQPGVSTFFSGIGILANIGLNWLLIFGYWGFPALGIKGAALATVLSGALEVVLLYGFLYWRQHVLAFDQVAWRKALNWQDVTRFFKLSMPTTINFLTWAGGLFAYQAIMGQTGVQGLAALAVMVPVESLALALMIGLSQAAAVLVGNQLGARQFDAVYYQAWAVVLFNFLISIVVASLLLLNQDTLLNAFSALTGETRVLANQFLVILAFGIILRSLPMMAIMGVLRAGGDVNFCLYQDLTAQWLIGIPLAAFAAIYLGWPPQTVYLLFLTEEIVKWLGCLQRMLSRKWMRNLVSD